MKPSDQGPLLRRQSSTPHYQTFGGISPPKSRGRPLSDSSNSSSHDLRNGDDEHHHGSPLPKKQMAILAVIALCEQTALNSISPYLPDMASTFPEVKPGQVGVYVGTIASAFALAQLATNFFWGWLSDHIGRKPVILLGTFFTAACFVAFGFVRTLPQAVAVQALMGLLNGNQGVVSTCLGEITDRSNQSKAFTYLPVIYGIGGITGPIIGGVLVSEKNPFNRSKPNKYPYLLPNLLSAVILLVDLALTAVFLEESLAEAQYLPPLGKRVRNLFSWVWQFTSSTRPHYLRHKGKRISQAHSDTSDEVSEDGDTDGDTGPPTFFPQTEELKRSDVLTRDTILLLLTYLVFQLSNISFNSLYPIFAEAAPPTGRSLNPEEIGLSLAFAGLVTIFFQIGIFGKLRDHMGNRWAYRTGLGGFVVAFILMPWVGYKNGDDGSVGTKGKAWLWIEICVVLLIKTVAAVGGLTSALLLVRLHERAPCGIKLTNRSQITNSAPNHSVLGTLNGLAQTLSAAGRAIGPFLSGGLFSLATKVHPKGEALAFGVFGGVAFVGFLLSFGIRSPSLEAEGWGSDEEDDSDKSEDEEDP
jgi:MFS family permease